ncbi:MAG: transcription-repair coupling factor [Kiritimatiellae bacterium]|nr:transcription-repair coupling factor [Kiritimatiellia bacterium]
MRTIAESFFRRLDETFPSVPQQCLALPALPGVSAALVAAYCAQKSPSAFCLVVTDRSTELDRVYSDLCALGRSTGVEAAPFPQPFDDDPDAEGARMRVIRTMQGFTSQREQDAPPLVVVTSLPALLQGVPDPDALNKASVTLRKGGAYEFSELVEKLSAGGYVRVEDVDSPGQFAVRGGILDVWPPGGEKPWRAEFFDVELESLRTFDPFTQCSDGKGDSVWLPPCVEKRTRKQIHLADLLPKGAEILWLDHDLIRTNVGLVALPDTTENRDGAENGLSNAGQTAWEKLQSEICRRQPALQCFAGEPAPPRVAAWELPITSLAGVSELGGDAVQHPELLAGAREKLFRRFNERAAAGEEVFLFSDTAGTAEMVNRELMRLLPETPSAPGQKANTVHVQRLAISGGFCLPGMMVAAQPDLYAVRKKLAPRVTSRSARQGIRVESASDLQPGDYVVHVEYGIGRFLGSTEIETTGEHGHRTRMEVFTIEYAEGGKIHVPVSQAHLLSKYIGIAGHRVRLHKLQGSRWSKDKANALRAVQDLAGTLLETQAKRAVIQGVAFNPNPMWMQEFEAAFPYQETIDQQKAIAAIKKDMSMPRPMDRLICGDAGYGKTEVAMRAAFLAVMNGYQVSVLVPTTVLAEQHYETFCDRMAQYPVNIRVLDRFHSQAKKDKICADLQSGKIDILIGTHALLSERVQFQKLGLLIIDEEQRFGVAHKEKLKLARQVVDVLTLSATPIPRTLYMSMTGARDMSLLQTPPRERVAVETKVARDSDTVVQEAIRQELDRGGQVYFLYNRVRTIDLMATRLRRLLPEARIAVGHGQMPSGELMQVMQAFQAGEVDVLLSTTIVENGLDIPRANTIIVDRADRFGIADLYQLRGRVGRSSQKGFAWLLLPENGMLMEDARNRIQAVKRNSGLGAGFNLALRDLEIRGAGNLLGREQSGQIAAVGFGLYCQLLNRTIARLKGEKPPLLVDVDVKLDFLEYSPGAVDLRNSACVPYGYIEDEGARMTFHRRLAELSTEKDVKALKTEIADRYGKPPSAISRLFKLTELRILAAQKGIARIVCENGTVCLYPRSRPQTPLQFHNHLPRLTGKTVEEKLAVLTRLVQSATGRQQ